MIFLRIAIVILLIAGGYVYPHARPLHGGGAGTAVTCNSLCTLLGTMTSGQLVRLTSSSPAYGNLNAQAPADGCSFDGATGADHCAGTGLSPWNSSVAALNSVYQGFSLEHGIVQYSTAGIDPVAFIVCLTGGGHVAMLDSGMYCFDANAGAASRLASGNGGSWALKIASAAYIKYTPPDTSTRPSGSYQTFSNSAVFAGSVDGSTGTVLTITSFTSGDGLVNSSGQVTCSCFNGSPSNIVNQLTGSTGSTGTYTISPAQTLSASGTITAWVQGELWAAPNLDASLPAYNQNQISSGHTYYSNVPLNGTGLWIAGGGFQADGKLYQAQTNGNASLVANINTGVTLLANGGSGSTLGSYITTLGQYVYDQGTGALYTITGYNSSFCGQCFYKVTNPGTATPTFARVTVSGQDSYFDNYPNLGDYSPNAVEMPDPNSAGEFDYVAEGTPFNKFWVISNMTGVSPAYAGTATIATYPTALECSPSVGGSYCGICPDPDNPGKIYVSDGTGYLARVTINPSNLSAATFVVDPATLSGDTMVGWQSGQATLYYNSCAVLPSTAPGMGGVAGGVLLYAYKQVYLRKL